MPQCRHRRRSPNDDINLTRIELKITMNGNGVLLLELKFNVLNIGHLPAACVWISLARGSVPVQMQTGEVLEKQDAVCTERKSEPPNNIGNTVFPGEVFRFPIVTGPTIKDWKEAIAARGSATPWLIGCVIYQFPNSSKQHFTRFVYEIRRKSTENEFDTYGLPSDPNDISLSQLAIVPFIFNRTFEAN